MTVMGSESVILCRIGKGLLTSMTFEKLSFKLNSRPGVEIKIWNKSLQPVNKLKLLGRTRNMQPRYLGFLFRLSPRRLVLWCLQAKLIKPSMKRRRRGRNVLVYIRYVSDKLKLATFRYPHEAISQFK